MGRMMTHRQVFQEVVFDRNVESGAPFNAESLRKEWRQYQEAQGQRPTAVHMLSNWVGVCISRAHVAGDIATNGEGQWQSTQSLT